VGKAFKVQSLQHGQDIAYSIKIKEGRCLCVWAVQQPQKKALGETPGAAISIKKKSTIKSVFVFKTLV
jgi:hypothetical protein